VGKFLHWKQTAAKNGPLLSIAERDYLVALIGDLKAIQSRPAEGRDPCDLLLEAFNLAKVMRDELLELFAVNAAQVSGRSSSGRIGPILERLLDLRSLDPAPKQRSVIGNEARDLFLYELFLYTITQLIASEDYHIAANLLDRQYPAEDRNRYSGRGLSTFATFYTHSEILEQYNSRQQQRYRDYQSMLISQRCTLEYLSLDLLVQTDILLAVHAIVSEEEEWYPRMLFFRERSPVLPLFAQAKREAGFQNLAVLLGIANRQELAACFAKKIEDGKHELSHWRHAGLLSKVIGLDNITGK
jgi:hypothetical protein